MELGESFPYSSYDFSHFVFPIFVEISPKSLIFKPNFFTDGSSTDGSAQARRHGAAEQARPGGCASSGARRGARGSPHRAGPSAPGLPPLLLERPAEGVRGTLCFSATWPISGKGQLDIRH